VTGPGGIMPPGFALEEATMVDPSDKTGFEVAQEVRIKLAAARLSERITDAILEHIVDAAKNEPLATEEEVADFVRGRVREMSASGNLQALINRAVAEDPSIGDETTVAQLGLMMAQVAREEGLSPLDPNRGDAWGHPATDRILRIMPRHMREKLVRGESIDPEDFFR
jgi:hypothetical protein